MTISTLFRDAIVLAALAGMTAAPALAGGKHRQSSARTTVGEPVKACPKVNGRYGYYGNPFCTAAEQLRFDRWEARQLGKQ